MSDKDKLFALHEQFLQSEFYKKYQHERRIFADGFVDYEYISFRGFFVTHSFFFSLLLEDPSCMMTSCRSNPGTSRPTSTFHLLQTVATLITTV